MSYNLLIGAHVSMNQKNEYLIGALQETINYNANCFMIFIGPPLSSIRKPVENFNIEQFNTLAKQSNISLNNLIIHAPYIVNLANYTNLSSFNFSVQFLKTEVKRAEKIGINTIVLHPGSAINGTDNLALQQVAKGLNEILKTATTAKIALETMAGKGNEVGINFDQLKYIIDNVEQKDKIGVCWDTCHMHDAGYDFKNNLDNIIEEFEEKIGLDKLLVMHINDSKNIIGSRKDRHQNIGYGEIGFETLLNIIYHSKFNNIVKILETPYIGKDSPYKQEIMMIHQKKFNDFKQT